MNEIVSSVIAFAIGGIAYIALIVILKNKRKRRTTAEIIESLWAKMNKQDKGGKDMKAVIHKTGAIGEVLGIERRDDGNEYVYFQNGLCKPISEVGFLNPYEQYEEDCYDWANFRREAAKDILPAIIDKKSSFCSYGEIAEEAITFADELIKQLKEKK